jgi:hypothetical protein
MFGVIIVDVFGVEVYFIDWSGCLNFQVLQGLDAASATVDDMDEWLRIFNLKLRHMREDIASVCLGVPSIRCLVYSIYLLDA